MAVNTQFSIAVHVMAVLGWCSESEITSGDLAESVNTSASFVRRVLSKLSKSGLVHTTTGKHGACKLARKTTTVSLLDIYKAVDAPKAFAIHTYAPLSPCMVSCNIKKALECVLNKTQKNMEETLAKIKLSDVINELEK